MAKPTKKRKKEVKAKVPAAKNNKPEKKKAPENKEKKSSLSLAKKNKIKSEQKALKQLERTRAQAFTKPKKRRGWFAERGQHALVARGIEVRKKELVRYKIIYSVFVVISLALAVMSLAKENLLSFSIAIVIIFFTVICYMSAIERNKRQTIIYILAWPLIFGLAVASIFKKNFLSFGIAIIAMAMSSLTPMLIKAKSRKEEIIRSVRELQKSRKSTETDFDKLLVLLQQFGSIRISEISTAFGIDRKKAEEWAAIMEENKLASLHYPAFGEEELTKK